MFIHNFKYSLKTLFRNKMLIFWTFAFPIILGTMFNLAFSNIANSEKFDIIDINHAHRLVFEYIDMFYNTRRIHSHCSYIPPNVYEKLYYMQHATESSIAA